MKIGIGIDTGGTCTDAVAYDYRSGKLIAKGKSLTTREDLSIGIGQALDQLPQELIRNAKIVSLSTTLATNACLEGKGGRAKLLIFGLSDEILVRWDAESKYGLERSSTRCIDMLGSADGLNIVEPDWDVILSEHGRWLADADALSAAEVYSMNNGAPCEKHLKKLSEEQFHLPCVCASEFTNELNVLIRGATALLNARMFPIVREFVETAIADFRKRGCKAPVFVVRSDGSTMASELSLERPVETILSGPAASVLAGKTFCDEQDYIIVDMGGTTTDISVVRGGRPVTAEGGIRIGNWQTTIKGVLVAPFALGGDSTVRLNDGKLQLFPRRATPISAAAKRWPEVKAMLSELLDRTGENIKRANIFPLHEIFYLVREPAEQKSYSPYELALIDELRKGPCILETLHEAGIDLYHLDSERLESEGIIMRCGLTPTDFMHIKGDYNGYDKEAAVLAARHLLLVMNREDTPKALHALADEVYELVEGRMYENLLQVMLMQQHHTAFSGGVDEQTKLLIQKAWETRKTKGNGLLRHTFGTNAALVGIGAPTHVFLPAVAKALGAPCILPEHAEVANALGALKANIDVTVRVEVSQRLSSQGRIFYIAHMPTGSMSFDTIEEAIAAAKPSAETT
ncbi:MAG: hypothetical protein FWB97_11165, partial [Oscillospiraceae bacterium]|nr:hypothetical protein [Oscillospiraceae bacterium]